MYIIAEYEQQRRDMLQWWADYVQGLVNESKVLVGNFVRMPSRTSLGYHFQNRKPISSTPRPWIESTPAWPKALPEVKETARTTETSPRRKKR